MSAQTLARSFRSALAARRVDVLLDRAAFTALMLLGVCFAVELRRPAIDIGGWFLLTNIESLYLLVIALWCASRIVGGRRPAFPPNAAAAAMPWMTWLALSTLAAPAYRDQAAMFMTRIIGGVLVGAVVFDLADTPQRRSALIASLAFGGCVIAASSLAEASAHPRVLDWLAGFKVSQTRVGDVVRVSGTLGYATITAMVLEMTLPLMLSLLLTTSSRWGRVLIGAGLVGAVTALVLTLSRAGIVAMMAALIVVAWFGWRAHHRQIVTAAALIALLMLGLVGAVMLWNPTVALRLSTETEQSWYRAEYYAPNQVEARPGDLIEIPIQVVNTSVRRWESAGTQPFALSYHLLDEHGEVITYDGIRTPLSRDVAPGQIVTLDAVIAIPAEPGVYALEWDMVQEAVSWFSWKDTPTASTMLAVSGTRVDAAEIALTAPPTDIRILEPTATRFELWRAALKMALDRPVLGVGPDNFRWQYGHYAGLNAWNTDIHANNLYLEWLADTGVVGLAAFLWLMAEILRAAYRATFANKDWGREVGRRKLLAIGLFAALIAWYVHGVFDAFYEFTPTYLAFWLVVGLALRFEQEVGE